MSDFEPPTQEQLAEHARIQMLRDRVYPKKLEGGIYEPGLSFAQYRAVGEGSQILTVNASLLKEPTPLHAKYSLGREKKGEALNIGDALHKALLEPQVFEADFEKYYITSRTDTLDTKANARLAELYPDHIVLTQDMIDSVKWMRDAIFRHPRAVSLLDDCRPEDRELTGIVPDPAAGIVRKIRIDAKPRTWDCLVDIKSTRDLMERAFYYDLRKFGYHLQGSYYLDTDAHITGKRRSQFIILGVTNVPPYYARVYTLHQDDLNEGQVLYHHRLAALTQAAAHNNWHAFEHEDEPVLISRLSAA